MSDKFHGTFQADDGSYATYAAFLHQQQQSGQAKNQSLLQQQVLNSSNAELNNYFCSTTNINSITAATTAAVSSAFDTASTQSRLIGPSLRYYGGGGGATYGSQQQQQHLLYNGNTLMSQQNALGENGAYNIPATAALALGSPLDGAGGASYSGAAAAMPFSYNRNRYMPYSRTINVNGVAPYQHALQSAMPIRAFSSLPITTAPLVNVNAQQAAYSSYSTYQPFANTYPNYPNFIAAASVAITSGNDNNSSSFGDSSGTGGAATQMNGCATPLCEHLALRNDSDGESVSPPSGADTNAVAIPDNNDADGANGSESYCQVCTTSSNQSITLQITNLDYTMDEPCLRNFLMGQLRPITPVLSLIFEGNSYAKVTVPDMFFAKQVVAYLHRKKIGHKRMLVSYTRDFSQTDLNTLRCQVAGLLKDVPYYTLPMYKFRELFQARFKTSISVVDLYKLPDICTITVDSCEEKFIGLQTGVISTLENSPLMEGLQHSVPYCKVHFKREQHKGWAEQEIEPLPNVWMTISEIQKLIYPLLKNHHGDIPIASLVHCISGQMKHEIKTDENGVNLEHLVCCVQGIQIKLNTFGIKILGWLEVNKDNYANTLSNSISFNTSTTALERSVYAKSGCSVSDPLYQISREVIELVKMSPKSTMKFNRFIPAYHNHFGKQCRVADYGYTKLIELFEALTTVVQIIGDGENRLVTLTHRTQLRRFTSDLLRILRANGNKAVLVSQLPSIFSQYQHRRFNVTDYGVCDIRDILDGLANSNVVVISHVKNGDDMLISLPKRKQTTTELEKTILFAGEMVELFRNAPQYTILFQKFVRSYHYHFAYQCRLSDYGFLKLADLMEAIQGVVEMEQTTDEDKKIYLSAKVARRVFAEQCEELINDLTGSAKTCVKLEEVLKLHKKKFGYQIQPQTLGVRSLDEGVELLPYIELTEKQKVQWITCHRGDATFRGQCYRACRLVLSYEATALTSGDGGESSVSSTTDSKENQCKYYALKSLLEEFNKKYEDNISESTVRAMKHLIEIFKENDVSYVRSSEFLKFLLCIIRLIEKRSSIILSEIANTLRCKITTTFEFGYPNLYAVLTAYNDIFVVNMDATQDRSEISLQPNCELHVSALLNRSGLLNSTKPQQANRQKASRPLRPPLSENRRSYSNQGPPAKTRALSTVSTNENTTNSQVSQACKGNRVSNTAYAPPLAPPPPPPIKVQHITLPRQKLQQTMMPAPAQQPQPHHLQQALQIQQQMHVNLYEPKNCQLNSNANNSIYSIASHNSSLNTSASSSVHNDTSCNSSFGGALNHSLNSTNLSASELNCSRTQLAHAAEFQQSAAIPSTTLIPTSGANVNFWDRHYAATTAGVDVTAAAVACHQQPMPMLIENVQSGQASLIMSTSESAAMDAHRQHQHQYELPLQQQQALQAAIERSMLLAQNKIKHEGNNNQGTNLHMYAMFEPPKPDTPPYNTMPYWIDPIWSQNTPENETAKNVLLPIKLPELKSLNVPPMALSPYTLSKTENMKQKLFNFDNHNRNIA